MPELSLKMRTLFSKKSIFRQTIKVIFSKYSENTHYVLTKAVLSI
jgi:hypothetical protein